MPNWVTKPLLCGNLVFMTGNNSKSPATGYNPAVHFGNQVRKARRHRGWTIHDLAREADINAGHLSRIENGKRPPSEDVAIKLDGVFTERQGWFLDYYHDSESWTPPGYRHWAEHEATAPRLRTWVPGGPPRSPAHRGLRAGTGQRSVGRARRGDRGPDGQPNGAPAPRPLPGKTPDRLVLGGRAESVPLRGFAGDHGGAA